LALWSALRPPSGKQKDLYARYCHTLSAAAVIAAISLVFADYAMTLSLLLRSSTMFVAAVVLFAGAPLTREE
jgi:hypothetical protein